MSCIGIWHVFFDKIKHYIKKKKKKKFQVTEAEKDFRSILHSQEEEGNCLKDGGAHAEE